MENLNNFLRIVRLIRRDRGNRHRKNYRVRINPFQKYNDSEFYKIYRIDKDLARKIIQMVRPQLMQNPNNRGLPIPHEIQVLAFIRHCAKGAYQQDSADLLGLSQQTMSRVVAQISRAIAVHAEEYIYMPRKIQEATSIKHGFHDTAGMVNIIGAIDCTHVKIKNPGGQYAQTFINRKGWFSLNVQVVCDSNCKILDVIARHRGSVHDSRIWNNCSLKRRFENEEFRGILVGDSGYACTNYLLTPVLNPTTIHQERYNRAHIRTRNCVERLFGQWKNKFRCLFNGINTSLETSKAIIVALAVIHNLCVENNLIEYVEPVLELNEENNDYNEQDFRGSAFRNRYIQNNF